MKYILLIVSFLLTIGTVSAQNWQTDIEKAKTEATKNHKPILLVFQGSDWCAPCIKLNKEIWESEEFKDYADKNLVLLKADFPRKKANALDASQQEKNNELAATYNRNGYFPFVVLLDASGKVLGTTGYKKVSPKEYITELESFYK